jgi:hypothetical protein
MTDINRALQSTHAIFERDGVQTPVRISLWLDELDTLAYTARVEFEGSDVAPSIGQADTPHEALILAVRSADVKLKVLHASGVAVLRYQHDVGFRVFVPLAYQFAFVLRAFGPRPDAKIVS